MIYEPAEDSFLLQEYVKKYASGLVLDMGTGSGIQAETAATTADFVIGIDIDKDAYKQCVKNIKKDNITFYKSNLFQVFEENFFWYNPADNVMEVTSKKTAPRDEKKVLAHKQIKFDLIIFNPPYLPQELAERDIALEGGEKGYETLARFFAKAPAYLKNEGRIIIVFSSFTKKQRVNDIIHKAGLRYIELKKQHVFFEDLFVYYVTK